MSEIFTLRYVFVFIDNFGVENKSGACEGSNIAAVVCVVVEEGGKCQWKYDVISSMTT